MFHSQALIFFFSVISICIISVISPITCEFSLPLSIHDSFFLLRFYIISTPNCEAQIHDPGVQSHALHQLTQPGAPCHFLFNDFFLLLLLLLLLYSFAFQVFHCILLVLCFFYCIKYCTYFFSISSILIILKCFCFYF